MFVRMSINAALQWCSSSSSSSDGAVTVKLRTVENTRVWWIRVNPYQPQHGSGSDDGKNRDQRKCTCAIPFLLCGSGTRRRCGIFLSLRGTIRRRKKREKKIYNGTTQSSHTYMLAFFCRRCHCCTASAPHYGITPCFLFSAKKWERTKYEGLIPFSWCGGTAVTRGVLRCTSLGAGDSIALLVLRVLCGVWRKCYCWLWYYRFSLWRPSAFFPSSSSFIFFYNYKVIFFQDSKIQNKTKNKNEKKVPKFCLSTLLPDPVNEVHINILMGRYWFALPHLTLPFALSCIVWTWL